MRPSQEGMRPVIRLFLILTKVVAVRDPSQQGMEPDRARETNTGSSRSNKAAAVTNKSERRCSTGVSVGH